ncbi:peroxisomal bifunctional enzyme [Triplophysa rosa]|uniref:Peroxisomal bifunctional enzyme n=1 Tax=Triplophysa rosa TaxID=992332 RepID=A0A9W8C6G8_TRIRA|nr:peroxisomal bifunctional enzyme [Triplophysa rosa]KAI7808750.1 peroxisomal bifunctional enzyme [Triplophysa rosa]
MARYELVKGSLALITLTNPPVNALSSAVRYGITEKIKRALGDPKVKAVVICGENERFCGGADIREFAAPMRGHSLVMLFDDIEAGEKPVIAAIEGVALGGGFELALACHYRIAHSKARLGLPEVTLGLLPAAGGTQRLPRLIGIPAALELITTGHHVSAQEALKLGMVDQITDENACKMAVEFALRAVAKPLSSRRISTLTMPCPPNLDALFEAVTMQVQKKARGVMAPLACIQAVRAAATLPYSKGMKRESELMASLFSSSQARALQYCFFAQRTAGKWTLPSGAQWSNIKPRDIRRAAVIGLGTMGRGIAVSLARVGISVIAVETEKKLLETGRQMVIGMLERDAKRRGVTASLYLLQFTLSLQDVKDVDIVIEAVFEDMSLKKRLFRDLSKVCRPSTLLYTNTSGLDVDALAGVTDRPHMVAGMHFFSPAHVMKLLEVICGPRSSSETIATAMSLGKRMGKVCVAVGNCPGFVGNRMVKTYTDQANFLLEEGATPEQVDGALEEFGFAMGVFRMSDLAGLDVGWRIRKESGLTGPDVDPKDPPHRRQGHRYSPIPDMLCEQGRMGQKTGCGWYVYEKPGGTEAKPDPLIQKLLEGYRVRYSIQPRKISSQELIERCLYVLANEGFRVLEDGIAVQPEDIDVIYLFGYGFPRHRGGPMFYANMVGLGRVLDRLEHYHHAHPDVPHLKPSQLLKKLVACGSPPIQKWKEHIKTMHSHL